MPTPTRQTLILALTLLTALFMGRSTLDADDSQLRKFEKTLDSQKQTTNDNKPSGLPSSRQQAEDESRRQWRRDHPGEPYPGDEEDESLLEMIFGPLIQATVLAPFTLPYKLLDDSHHRPFGYQAYPFADELGYTDDDGRTWTITAGGAQHLLSGATYGVRGDVKAAFLQRWMFEGAHTKYHEPLDTRSEFLSFTEALGTYVFARNPNIEFRAGAGYQHVEGVGNYDGIKVVYRSRFFLKPVRFDADLGATFGVGKTILELRPAVAVHWRRAEVSLGYRRTSVRGEKIQGPEIGLAFWF